MDIRSFTTKYLGEIDKLYHETAGQQGWRDTSTPNKGGMEDRRSSTTKIKKKFQTDARSHFLASVVNMYNYTEK